MSTVPQEGSPGGRPQGSCGRPPLDQRVSEVSNPRPSLGARTAGLPFTPSRIIDPPPRHRPVTVDHPSTHGGREGRGPETEPQTRTPRLCRTGPGRGLLDKTSEPVSHSVNTVKIHFFVRDLQGLTSSSLGRARVVAYQELGVLRETWDEACSLLRGLSETPPRPDVQSSTPSTLFVSPDPVLRVLPLPLPLRSRTVHTGVDGCVPGGRWRGVTTGVPDRERVKGWSSPRVLSPRFGGGRLLPSSS